MTDIWFYHLEKYSVEHVLPRILHGLYQRGERICVCGVDQAQLAVLSKQLWSLEETSFVPHGLCWEQGHETDAICFTTGPDNPNGSDHLIYTGHIPAQFGDERRLSVFFDGNDDETVVAARSAWKVCRSNGQNLKYWRQNEFGRWED
jgi:DNA polymerase III subunit chi